MTASDRFWAKVTKTETCWLWTGAVTSRGYGCVGIGGKRYLTHRVAYEALVGPIPAGLTIDHVKPRCTSKLCCNPAHLEPVTQAENNRRAAALITHCKRGHLLLPPASMEKRQRRCGECGKGRWRPSTPEQIPAGTEHGLTTYNFYRCRCDICRAANAAHSREHYRKRTARALLDAA